MGKFVTTKFITLLHSFKLSFSPFLLNFRRLRCVTRRTQPPLFTPVAGLVCEQAHLAHLRVEEQGENKYHKISKR